ncbi:S-adenosyl-L-methionine-dependent methyltransferase [Hypoxylon crocopeplum]|nr:S-adenosyl-L-methionine-dependent methyltransferase [Hypoxylon crocopeplum]
MASTNRIIELSSIIATETARVQDFLVKNKLPTPSLDADALWSLPIPKSAPDVEASRLAVIEACSELKALMTGPKQLVRFDWTAYVSVKAILCFKLEKSFPVGESTSFESISRFSGLNIMNVRRIVRHAIINHHFFQEKTPGIITHSALTAVLTGDELMRNSLVVELDEFWPAGVKMADAMEKWPNSEENNETGFALANNSNKSTYDIFAENTDRAERFGMYFSKSDQSVDGILDNYAWANTETMVDVGGSHGSVAISIAEQFPNIKCVVQDLPDTVAEGASRLPARLRDRVTFVAHDFFTDQTVSADVYYFRSIFHNWADKYCIKILQKLIPALKPGARIIIHERILPGFDTLSTADARRGMDATALNSQQREMHEWPELFRQVDPRFRYLGARRPTGAIRWIIEAEWQG